MTANKRMRYGAAKRLLDAYCRAADGKPASSNKVPAKDRNPDGKHRDWWLENQGTCPPADGPRTKAYLKAYLEIGEEIFFGTGVPLDGGYMHPDRAVMKTLLLGDYVVLDETRHGRFVVTETGRDLIRDVPTISTKDD